MAPFYDLLSVATYDTRAFGKNGWPAQTQLAWPILGVRHFSDIKRSLLLDAAASLNLVKGTAERLLENIRRRAVQVAEALYAEVEAENAKVVSLRPELAPVFAGEAHCLHSILHGVLKDMSRQVA